MDRVSKRSGGRAAGIVAALALMLVALGLTAAEPNRPLVKHAKPEQKEQSTPSQGPAGMITFFVGRANCPQGWVTSADFGNNLLLGTTDPQQVRANQIGAGSNHTHNISSSITLPERAIAGASGCCNAQGARSGAQPLENVRFGRAFGDRLPIRRLHTCTPAEDSQ